VTDCRDGEGGVTVRPGADRRLNVLAISHMYPHPDVMHAGIFVQEQLQALSALADVTVVVGRYGLGLSGASSTSGSPRLSVVEVALPWCRALPSAARLLCLLPSYRRAAIRVARSSARPIDVVHAHYGFPDGIVGISVGSALGVPVVVTMHGSDFTRQVARPLFGRLLARRLARARRIICVSEDIATGMRPFAKCPDQIVHLPNGYNDLHISLHAERDPAYFLFVGSLIPRKNPDALVEAYGRIASQTPLDLVIVGDGPMMPELRERVNRDGIADRVRFEGQVAHERVDGYLRNAAALVLPSSREGMPIIVNEALASGTPVIATRTPGVQQQVTSTRLGTLVDIGDIPGLAAAMVDMARRSVDYEGVARESGVIPWSRYASRLLDLYRAVMPCSPMES